MATASQLADQLASGDLPTRQAAASTLATLGPDAAPAAAALVDACGTEALRDTCVGALEELGPPPVDQLPRLGELVGSLNVDAAYWAATLIGRSGEAAASHASQLVSVVVDETAPLPARERAAWALAKLGPTDAAASERLAALAADSSNPRLARLVAEVTGG